MDQLAYLMDNYPLFKSLISIMILCRLIFKPLFTILRKYVELTVEDNDNKKLNAFMKTKKYKMIAFIVDMLASVKMPKVRKGRKCRY